MPLSVLQAAVVAKKFTSEVRTELEKMSIKPTLIGFLANSDPSAKTYASFTAKACEEVGINFKLVTLCREQLESAILDANDDDTVAGIMVYYPVFGGGHDQYLQNCVNKYKDVEGLSHVYRFNMYHNIRYLDDNFSQKCIIPCTPLAIIKILEHAGVYDTSLKAGEQLTGKTITVINRSEVVGRPLAALLANDGATVYSVDINDVLLFSKRLEHKKIEDKQDEIKQNVTKQVEKTETKTDSKTKMLSKHKVSECSMKLDQLLPISDVVVSGVPTKDFQLPVNQLKSSCVAVNFASVPNINKDQLIEWCSENEATLVPSIGKVTITMLQRNLLRLARYQGLGSKNGSTRSSTPEPEVNGNGVNGNGKHN